MLHEFITYISFWPYKQLCLALSVACIPGGVMFPIWLPHMHTSRGKAHITSST